MNVGISSGGSTHSVISTYEAVGKYARAVGALPASQPDGVTIFSQSELDSSASKQRSTQCSRSQQ